MLRQHLSYLIHIAPAIFLCLKWRIAWGSAASQKHVIVNMLCWLHLCKELLAKGADRSWVLLVQFTSICIDIIEETLKYAVSVFVDELSTVKDESVE